MLKAVERAGSGVELRASWLIMSTAETDWRAAEPAVPAAAQREYMNTLGQTVAPGPTRSDEMPR